MTKERVLHDWNYVQQCYKLADTDEERHHSNKTGRAIYERAIKEFGFEWVRKNLLPLDISEIKL